MDEELAAACKEQRTPASRHRSGMAEKCRGDQGAMAHVKEDHRARSMRTEHGGGRSARATGNRRRRNAVRRAASELRAPPGRRTQARGRTAAGGGNRWCATEVTAEEIAEVVSALDRRAGGQDVAGRARKAARKWKAQLRRARGRSGRGGEGGGRRGAPEPRAGWVRPEPADGLVPVPRRRRASARPSCASALAEFLFDDEASMVRIDMSEFMEKHSGLPA